MTKYDTSPIDARSEAEIFEELRMLCKSPGYIHVIAYFCWRDNIIKYSGDKVTESDVEHQYSDEKLLRTEISTLIGLMVQGEIDYSIPAPKVLQEYIDKSEELLHEIHMSLQKPWMEAFKRIAKDHSSGKTREHPFSAPGGLREPIFYAAESAYNFQYEELAEKKYNLDSDWLVSNMGFTISDAKTVTRAILELQMRHLLDLNDEMIKKHPDKWTFLPGFIFKVNELANQTGLNHVIVENVISAFTFDHSNQNSSFSTLSSFNETNAAPIVQIDGDTYVLLQVYSLLEAIYEAPFFWMLGDKSYASTASKNRGQFAEQFIADRLGTVFGENHVFQNVDIYKGKQRFAEADVLVIYGNRAIVVQAKSKRLTIEARKGNDLQLRDDFKKAIEDAYDQALQCAEALKRDDCRFVLPSGEELELETRPSTVFPVCVVSDHFPALAAQARRFLRIKSGKGVKPPIVTDIFFTDVLTEILGNPLQFLNYMALRAKADDQLLVNQELSILGYHLKHNLWLEEKYNIVNLGDDFTSSLDIAMSARRSGVPGEHVPKGILTRFDGTPIGALISEFEARPVPELVSLGLTFLQLSSEAAKHINNGINQLVQLSAKDGKLHDFSIPHELENSGVTIHVSPFAEDKAKDRLSTHCKIRKHDTKSDSWYGLLLAPGTGAIRGALLIEEEWRPDAKLDEALKNWPTKPMIPISSLSKIPIRKKIGRNERCPCGSGLKYKKCCLNLS
ncbi:MAG: NERD domain-containing protein [Lentilitoribacter sp.]